MIVKQFLLEKVDIIFHKVDPFLEKWFGVADKIPGKTRKKPNLVLFGALFMLAAAIYTIYGFLIGKDSVFAILIGIVWFLSASSLYRTWTVIRK